MKASAGNKGLPIKTVVAIFIKNGLLLMEKRGADKKVYAGFLMCPSGHIKENEPLEQAMAREMREELGIKIKSQHFLFTIDDIDPHSKRLFSHNFMCIDSFDGAIGKSCEAKKLCWKSYPGLKKEKLALIVRTLVERLHEKDSF